MPHWCTSYDPDDGNPYGCLCECGLGEDHNRAELRAYEDEVERAMAQADLEAEAHERNGDG